jgi:hypothetical protein
LPGVADFAGRGPIVTTLARSPTRELVERSEAEDGANDRGGEAGVVGKTARISPRVKPQGGGFRQYVERGYAASVEPMELAISRRCPAFGRRIHPLMKPAESVLNARMGLIAFE